MTGRKLATPGALMILAGSFLLYWGLREFGIVGQQDSTSTDATTTSSPPTQPTTQRSA